MVNTYLVLFISGFVFPTTSPFGDSSFPKEENFGWLDIRSFLQFHSLCLPDTARRVPTSDGYLLIFNF